MASQDTTPVTALRGKQRELQEREERLLAMARQVFLEEGYHAVTIEYLARLLGFARGTLYQRFNGKETLLLELAIRCRQQIIESMDYVSRIPGRPRERMAAIGHLISYHAALYADNLRIIWVVDSEIVLEKASESQVTRMREMDRDIFRIIQRIVEEAVAIGDLTLPEGSSVGSVCLALWALVYGWAQTHRHPSRFQELGVAEPGLAILSSAQRLMDGFHWRPLRAEWDYEGVYGRVEEALKHFHGEEEGAKP